MANAGEGGLVVQAGAAPGAQGVGWGCPEPAQEEVVCLPAGREGLSGPVGEDDLGGQRRCPQAQGWKGASSGRAQVAPTTHRTLSSIWISQKHGNVLEKVYPK